MDKVDRSMVSMLFALTMALILVMAHEIKEEIRAANKTLLEELKK